MRRWMILAVMLATALVPGATASRAEWKMRVHEGDSFQEFAVSGIDSLTFYEAASEGMIWIPPGYVRMGIPGEPLATPIHDVWVDGFWIGKYSVTNGEYSEFIDAGGYDNPEWWIPVGWDWRVAQNITLPANWDSDEYHGGGVPGNESFPVYGVSWWEADAYCRWAGMRLPTEVEWEKAARGGCEMWGDPDQCDGADTPTYPWGEGISGQRANYWDSGDPYEDNGWTTPVGYYDGSNHGGFQTIDSPSPYGLYDAAGNVFTWTSTGWAGYPYDPDDGREDPPATWFECCRVTRGGSWGSGTAPLRTGNRGNQYPQYRHGSTGQGYGIRCVMD